MALSVTIGVLVPVDPALTEVASRTRARDGDIALALASGLARALAFTTGVSTTLIGVMVAVALLPPLVAFGLLLGGGLSGVGHGCLVAVSDEPDLCEPCGRDDVSGAGHSPGDLVEKRSGRESHANRHRAVGGTVGGVGRSESCCYKRAEYDTAQKRN